MVSDINLVVAQGWKKQDLGESDYKEAQDNLGVMDIILIMIIVSFVKVYQTAHFKYI